MCVCVCVCVSRQGVSPTDGPAVASLRRLLRFWVTVGSFGVKFLWYCILVCEYFCCLLSPRQWAFAHHVSNSGEEFFFLFVLRLSYRKLSRPY